LGIFTNNTIVGYYSGAEKIIKAVQGLLSPISQTIYPHISKLANESKDQALRFIRKLTFLVGGGSFVLSLVIFIFADVIVNILLGNQYLESTAVLRILAFIPFIVALSNVFSVQGLIAFGHSKIIPRIVVFGSLLDIFLIIILYLLSFVNEQSPAIAWLSAEVCVTLLSYKYFRKDTMSYGENN